MSTSQLYKVIKDDSSVMKDPDGIYIKTKLFSTKAKGYPQIADYQVTVHNFPVSNIDTVNNYLVNLFEYIKKSPVQEKDRGNYLKNHVEEILWVTPIKRGGNKGKTIKRKRRQRKTLKKTNIMK